MRRRHFSERFKKDAASRVIDTDLTQAQVARDLGLHPTTLGRWIQKERRRRTLEDDLGPHNAPDMPVIGNNPVLADMRNKLDEIQRENDRLQRENEFLAATVDQLLDDGRAMRRYEIISHAINAGESLPVTTMCDALGVSRTGYIRWNKKGPDSRERKREELDRLVKQIFEDSGRIFGAPRIVAALKERGISVGHQTVYRSMYRLGLEGTNQATRAS